MLDYSVTALANLPDFAVLNEPQTCTVLGISRDTLKRLDDNDDGPEWVWLSANRKGRTVAAIRAWLQRRAESRTARPAPPGKQVAA
jgi:hypothetical protein